MEPTASAAAPTDAPLPASVATIDLEHLARMTLGERSLEAEVLTLFDRQAAILLARMRDSTPAAVIREIRAHVFSAAALYGKRMIVFARKSAMV